MTNQSLFDQVVTHAVTQGEKSQHLKDGCRRCLYRGPKGLKCFIGALIPDEIYEAEMEDKNATLLCEEYPEVLALFKGADVSLIHDLQRVHDGVEVGEWVDQLRKTAEAYGLSTRVLEEVPLHD